MDKMVFAKQWAPSQSAPPGPCHINTGSRAPIYIVHPGPAPRLANSLYPNAGVFGPFPVDFWRSHAIGQKSRKSAKKGSFFALSKSTVNLFFSFTSIIFSAPAPRGPLNMSIHDGWSLHIYHTFRADWGLFAYKIGGYVLSPPLYIHMAILLLK